MAEPERDPWSLIVRTFLLLAGSLLALYLAIQIRGLLILIVVAAILSTAINPAANLVHKLRLPPRGWRIPKIVVVLLIYTGILVLLGLAGLFIVPPLIEQARGFIEELPAILDQLQALQADLEQRFPQLPMVRLTPEDLQPFLQQLLQDPAVLLGYAFSLVDVIFSTALVSVLIIYFVIFADDIVDFGVSLAPQRYRQRARSTAADIGNRLGLWLGAQMLMSFIIFSLTLIGLLIIGMPFPVLLALVAGLGEFIPWVGPIVGWMAAGAVAAFISPLTFILVTAFYIVLQQIEGNVLGPIILGRVMRMSPVVILLAVLIGGSLLGLVGALIAVPIAAAIYVLFDAIRRPKSDEESG